MSRHPRPPHHPKRKPPMVPRPEPFIEREQPAADDTLAYVVIGAFEVEPGKLLCDIAHIAASVAGFDGLLQEYDEAMQIAWREIAVARSNKQMPVEWPTATRLGTRTRRKLIELMSQEPTTALLTGQQRDGSLARLELHSNWPRE